MNRTEADVIYLEIGDRIAGDEAFYPRDDMRARLDGEGKWIFMRKNGVPYQAVGDVRP